MHLQDHIDKAARDLLREILPDINYNQSTHNHRVHQTTSESAIRLAKRYRSLIDIEGSDYEVMMNLDFKKFKIENISIEYLHLNKLQKKKLIKRLMNYGYSYYGFGLDHNKIDWFFKKKVSKWNNFVTKFFPYIHRKHYKRLNRLLIK